MSSVVIHFASGAALFSGSACLLAGLLIVSCARRKLLPPIGRLLILAGLFLIVMSATPLPLWAWCVWGGTLLLWTASRHPKVAGGHRPAGWSRMPRPFFGAIQSESPTKVPDSASAGGRHAERACCNSTAALLAVVGVTFGAVLWEISWQLPPRGVQETLDQARKPDLQKRLVVIGDSLSAEDFTEGGDPWPTLLAREHGIDIVNLAFSGATARSAEKRVTPDDVAGAVVLVEIGGNDVLGHTSPADFERDLDRLLTKVCQQPQSGVALRDVRTDNMTSPPLPPLAKGGRTDGELRAGPVLVVMLELPLPPLFNRFGDIQRRLARRHNVVLVPKRYFASVLIGEQATLDGLHLSQSGHQKMANMIWALLAKRI